LEILKGSIFNKLCSKIISQKAFRRLPMPIRSLLGARTHKRGHDHGYRLSWQEPPQDSPDRQRLHQPERLESEEGLLLNSNMLRFFIPSYV